MEGINFKIASAGNIEEILEMMKDFNAIDNYPFYPEERKENLLHFINNKSLGRLWLIYQNDLLAGYTVLAFGFSFEFRGKDAFVDELFIRNEYRGKGIGSRTVDFVFEQAAILGVKALHLEVEKHNEKGKILYTKKGFRDHNRFLMTRFIG